MTATERVQYLMGRFDLSRADAERAAMMTTGSYRCEACGTVTTYPACSKGHGLARPLTAGERERYTQVGHAAFASEG